MQRQPRLMSRERRKLHVKSEFEWRQVVSIYEHSVHFLLGLVFKGLYLLVSGVLDKELWHKSGLGLKVLNQFKEFTSCSVLPCF
jgi:hypothetical protein